LEQQPSNIVKREVISSDKDGTLEKVWETPYDRVKLDGTIERVEPWEVRATGRKVKELKGVFKESSREDIQKQTRENETVGMQKITTPDGRIDEVRSDMVDFLKQHGFCKVRVRTGITIPKLPWHKNCGHSRHQDCHCQEE
jgi:hypothetical protein